MSKVSKTGEGEGAIDLLALLYPEDDVQMGEEPLDQQEGEFGQMLGLRSLFSAMPEEEPPDAISNRLLALAAQHAPAPSKSQSSGLWAWIGNVMTPLVSHPGLAAAASLVLVAGVAGTLYYKNGDQVAEPMAKSGALPPRAGANTLEATTKSPSENQVSASDENTIAPIEALVPPTPAQVQKPVLELRNQRTEKEGLSEANANKRTGKGKISRKSENDNFSFANGEESEIRKKKTSPEKSRKIGKKEAPAPKPSQSKDKPTSEKTTKASAPPQDRDDDFTQNGSEKKLDSSNDSSPGSSSVPATKAAVLHQQAKRAAKKGDCQAVLKFGQQIRKLDSAYYDTRFLADSGLRACRTASKR